MMLQRMGAWVLLLSPPSHPAPSHPPTQGWSPNTLLHRLALLGNAGVDVFLVLSSALAVYHLLPELEGRSGSAVDTRPAGNSAGSERKGSANLACTETRVASISQTVLRYYARRVRRIVPAYAVANLLIILLEVAARHGQQTAGGLSPLAAAAKGFCFANCPGGLWANALFVMHFLGRRGCGEFV